MKFEHAKELVDKDINLDAAKRAILATRQECDYLLEVIHARRLETLREQSQARMAAYKANPELCETRSELKEAYLNHNAFKGYDDFISKLYNYGHNVNITREEFEAVPYGNLYEALEYLGKFITIKK